MRRGITRPLFSERMAVERMGRLRRLIHWPIRTLYWAIPNRVIYQQYQSELDFIPRFTPWGRAIVGLWGAYRRTWPR